MTTIQTYLYTNRIEVQFWNPDVFLTRNFQVYARPVTVYQGIDNPISVIIKTQDQKPANLTGYIVEAQLQDTETKTTIVNISIQLVNAARGYGRMLIDRDTVNSLDKRIYKMTFKKTPIGEARFTPIYADMNQAVPMDLYVQPAYYSTMSTADRTSYIIDGGTI